MSTVEAMEDEPSSPGPPPLEDQNGMEVTAPVQKSAKLVQREFQQRLNKQRERRRLDLRALNQYIVCNLCKGYLIDPVTVVECLHSYCKSCIVKHVKTSKVCPACDVQIHKTKPLLSLRADKALQDIVYKVVPGLYRTEMKNRVKFYSNHPEVEPASPEDAGEVSDRLYFSPEDDISMSLEYFDSFSKETEMQKMLRPEGLETENPNRRFLQCKGSVNVNHLKKFIMTKYELDQNFLVDVIYKEDLLPEDQTLVDIAYSYNWRKTSPMRFYYRIYQKTKVLTRKRKKKRTRTGSKSQPARKKRNVETSWTSNADSLTTATATAMEVDNKEPISTSVDKSGGNEKLKITVSRDTLKKTSTTISPDASKSPSKPVPNLKKLEESVPKAANSVSVINKPVRGKEAVKDQLSVRGKEAVKEQLSAQSPVKRSPPVSSSVSKPDTKSVMVSKPSVLPNNTKTSASGVSSKHPANSVPNKPPTNIVANKLPANTVSNKPAANSVSRKPAANSVSRKPASSLQIVNTQLGKPTPSKPVSSKSVKVPKEKVNGRTDSPRETVPSNGLKAAVSASEVNQPSSKPEKTAAKPAGEKKEVVEISVEVSASDVIKVLEKKNRKEKDAKLLTSGEDKLYSNYSIVDQIKKAGSSAANLARQQTERASMMDFTRSSEALNAPRVPPTIQGLQPKIVSTESNGLSAIVQNLAQKQQKLQFAVTEPKELSRDSASCSPAVAGVKSKDSAALDSSKVKPSESAKTLGNMVAPILTTVQPSGPVNQAPKLPVSTSIKPILKEGKQTAVETGGAKGQQVLNFYKNNLTSRTSSLSDAAKKAETLTKNIPAGTTVTVKTVENKLNGKESPVSAATPVPPSSSPKTSAYKVNVSTTSNIANTTKGFINPFSSVASVSQESLINPFVHSPIQDSMMAQYLNYSNPGYSVALAARMQQTANAIRAAQAAANISSVTTLEFTKPTVTADESRIGLKIPTPTLNRNQSPISSSFGTSRLQLKVNPDTPKEAKTTKSPSPPASSALDAGSVPMITSNGKTSGTHCMPAILPFHSLNKMKALPKTQNQTARPITAAALLKGDVTKTSNVAQLPAHLAKTLNTSANSVQSLTDSNPFKTSAPAKPISRSLESFKKAGTPPSPTVPANINNPFKPLKKLSADLKTVQNNFLNSMKKTDKLGGDLKAFGGSENKGQEAGTGKEVTTS